MSSHSSPNAISNNKYASLGSQMKGSDESITAVMGVGKSPWLLLPEVPIMD